MNSIPSHIHQVTVYSDRAEVSRVAQKEVEKGEHYLVFDKLPEHINEKSIQVNGRGNAIIRDVKFKKVHYAEILDKHVKGLYNRELEVKDSIKELDDKIEHAQSERKFVENIAAKLTTTTEKATLTELNPENWIKMVQFYRSRLDGLDKEIRETEKMKRRLNDELEKVQKEIKDIGTNRHKTKNQVEVLVEAKEKGNIQLMLTYIVMGPSWRPFYDLRVSTEHKTMNITYHASIRQNTGEDWDDVQIRLSTAQPQISGQQPELSPWFLSIYHFDESRSVQAKKKSKAPAPMRQMFSRDDDMAAVYPELADAEKEMERMEVSEANVETGSTSVFFTINGTNTVKTDNQKSNVTIAIREFNAEFRYSTVPKLSPYAYLKAKVVNETDYPFLRGETNIFLNNNFVANAKMNLVAPSEEFWTFLGVDESIKVEHKLLKRYSTAEGNIFSKKSYKEVFEYLIILKNNKKTKENIVVWDQLPVSQTEQIVVELLAPKYKEDTDSLKMNEHKYLEWFFELEAGEEQKIPFKFSVEYPQNEVIDGLD